MYRTFALLCTKEGGFLGSLVVQNRLLMQDAQFQSLGQKDPLEKEMAANSSVLAWRIPGMGEPGGLQFMGSQKSQT